MAWSRTSARCIRRTESPEVTSYVGDEVTRLILGVAGGVRGWKSESETSGFVGLVELVPPDYPSSPSIRICRLAMRSPLWSPLDVQRRRRFFWFSWMPVLLWMGLIFWGSTDALAAHRTSRFLGPFLRWLVPGITPESEAAVRAVIRKGGHVTEYAILAILMARAVRATRDPESATRARRWILVAWLGATAYAATDEFHQSFQPTRQGSVIDVGIDSAGAALGLMGFAVWVERRERRQIR